MQPKPKKSLGQHFLAAPGITARIAALLAAKPEDNILEIGPGSGALTRELAKLNCNSLLLLEKDAYWAAEQQKKCPDAKVMHMDALLFKWRGLSGSWRIAGNLPYNVASPLIWDIVSLCDAWKGAIFMVQKEVAQRICAKHGSRQYGALSVWVQSFALPAYEFTVAPGCFRPPPKVDSGVVSLVPCKRSERDFSPAALKKLLALCFQNRRKQLGSIFRKTGQEAMLAGMAELRIDPRCRPEELSPAQFRQLAKKLE